MYYTKGKRKGVAMKDIFKSSLLYDFYGELLTEHQKEIYEDFILNDLSLGELTNLIISAMSTELNRLHSIF